MFGKKLIALDIGSNTTKIVYGASNGKNIFIYEYDIINTPDNCIKDGILTNPERLAGTLADAFKRNGIKGGDIVFSVTGTGVITREIQLPLSTDKELAQMLEFEAQQYFPVDLSNYTTDFKVLENIITDSSRQSKVLIAAAPNKQLEGYIQLLKLLKRSLHNIDIPANCVLKIQAYRTEKDVEHNEDYAIVDIGMDTSMVCIFRDNRLKFSRVLLNGSAEIDRLIANRINVDYKKAEELKISLKEQDEKQQEILGQVVEEALNNIVSDINRFIEFYNSRESINRVRKIYVCGGGSKLTGLVDYFSNSFNMEVLPLPIRKEIVYKGKKDKNIYQRDYIRLINAVGSLLS